MEQIHSGDLKEVKVGDRVRLLSAGYTPATILSLKPLTLQFDDLEKPIKVKESDKTWIKPIVNYSMPKIGDRIRINEKHWICAGREYEVCEVQEAGWVKTTTGNIFHYDCFC